MSAPDEAQDTTEKLGIALHEAVVRNSLSDVRSLLDRRADPSYRNAGMETPLHRSTWRGYEAMTQMLVDARCDLNATTTSNATALHYASEEGFINCVRIMLDAGADRTIISVRGGPRSLEIAGQSRFIIESRH